MPIIALSICTTSVYYGVPIYGSCEQRIQPQYVYTTPSQMHTTSTELVNLDLIDPKQVNDVRCYECSWCESHIAIDSEVIIDANIDANVIANDEIVDDISIDVDMVQYDLVTL